MKARLIQNFQLAAESAHGVALPLDPGAITETVTVTSEAMPSLHTETANVSTELSADAIQTLPQVGRDPYELVRLAPGMFGDAARSGAGGSVALPNSSGPG